MQLKNKKKITGALASATCALLGSSSLHAEGDMGWKIDTAYMLYSEKDRVEAAEPTLKAQKTFADDSKLSLNLVFDTLSGPSPNGAVPGNVPQTFTRASGHSIYVINPGDIPFDDNFHDSRTQIGMSWDAPINRLMRYNIGFNTSTEHDYQSMSVDGGMSWDFNKKNTTLSVSGSYAADKLNPIGGVPTPLATMNASGVLTYRDGTDETKNVFDILFGVSQVIDPRTIMQFNLGLSQSSGYLNDPYKVVSIVDPVTGIPLDVASGGAIYENRPDSRSKESLYWETKHHTTWGDTIDVSYRYMMDDWGINSHTVDFHYRWNILDNLYLQPHLRWYQQNEADFYKHELTAVPAPGTEVSADYRLAAFSATTAGFKVGYIFMPDNELNFRFEQYQQTGDTPSGLVGIQNSYEAYPDLDATIMQIGYSFKF